MRKTARSVLLGNALLIYRRSLVHGSQTAAAL
jgi:hypothetical protein